MSVVNSGSFSKALWPGVNKWYNEADPDYSPEYTEFMQVETSSKAYEEDVGTSEFGLTEEKAEGEGIAYDDTEQNHMARYTHLTYGKGFKITREMVEDDQYSVVAKLRATALKKSGHQTIETLAANHLNRAFDSNYKMAGDHDGSELISATHVGGPYQASYSNILGTAADLSETSLEDLLIQISQATDPRGLKVKLTGMKLIVPTQLCFTAERILRSDLQNDTANNAINALKSKGLLPGGYCINHYLTDSDAWFVKTSATDGLKWFNRRAMEFAADNSFDTENALYKMTFRVSSGWSNPRGIYGSQGA